MVDRRSSVPGKRSPAKRGTPAARRGSGTSNGAAAAAIVDAEAASIEKAESAVESGSTTGSAGPAVSESVVEKVAEVPVHSDESKPTSSTPESASRAGANATRVLDVFLVDSGWNTPVCAAVHENLPAINAFLKGHRFFVLTPEQSVQFVRRHPGMVGADPVLLVLDRNASRSKGDCGFRLCLGHVRQPEVAVAMLKWAIQLTMTASSAEMATIIRKSAHRETLQGAIELIGEGSTHLLEFAPV